MDKLSLHTEAKEESKEQNIEILSYSKFSELIDEEFSNVVFPKRTFLGKCDSCIKTALYVIVSFSLLLILLVTWPQKTETK